MEKGELITPEEKELLESAQRTLSNIAARANLLRTHMPREHQLTLPIYLGINACLISEVGSEIAHITTVIEETEEKF
ncbi:MAG: hypothetical protein ABIR46_00835 [Candidatus Saccharimonadales bacterium]